MKPRAMSLSRKVRIFEAAGGVCHLCGGLIDGVRERWDADHVIPLELSGDDSDANLRPAHERCHRVKTAVDQGDIARAKRVRAKHRGARGVSGAVIPGSKASPWKRTIDGRTVRRDGGAE